MEYLLLGVPAIALYFYFGYLRGKSFVERVARLVDLSLKDEGEADGAIAAYINSAAFAVTAKSSFGKLSEYRAAAQAVTAYRADAAKWRQIADRQ